MTGFKSPDRERFTALFARSISFPDREKTRTWSGNNNFFLVAECARGCYVLLSATHVTFDESEVSNSIT